MSDLCPRCKERPKRFSRTGKRQDYCVECNRDIYRAAKQKQRGTKHPRGANGKVETERRCKACGHTYALNAENFYHTGDGANRYRHVCIRCFREQCKQYPPMPRPRPEPEPMPVQFIVDHRRGVVELKRHRTLSQMPLADVRPNVLAIMKDFYTYRGYLVVEIEKERVAT